MVFVDDLDRCLPDKAIQVLEALKLFLDVEGCIFVLGLDPEAIEDAVRTRYQGEVKARQYLEKIIQLPFILPPIEDEPMREYVKSLAPALPDPRCEEVFAQGLTPNPRQVKRTLNIFLLLSRLVEKREALPETITAGAPGQDGGHPARPPRPLRPAAPAPRLPARPGGLFSGRRRRRAAGGRRSRTAPPAGGPGTLPGPGGAAAAALLCWTTRMPVSTPLTPLELRSYITLAHRATPVEAPAVRSARQRFEPEMVPVPAGPFLMGTSDEQVQAMLARYDWAKEFQDEGLVRARSSPSTR